MRSVSKKTKSQLNENFKNENNSEILGDLRKENNEMLEKVVVLKNQLEDGKRVDGVVKSKSKAKYDNIKV